jgi:hypothetical protein
MTTFKPGDEVQIHGWASLMTVALAEPDSAGMIICVNGKDGEYVRMPAKSCTLIPPKVYADIVKTKDGNITTPSCGGPLEYCMSLGRISWDGETLAVEP